MEKILILHLIDHYKIGGPGKTILNSAKFINNKFDIHIGVFQPSHCANDLLTAANKNNIPTIVLKDSIGLNIKNLFLLSKYIINNKITIVHSHGYKTNIIALFVKLIAPQIKIVTTLHGWIVNNPKQYIYKLCDLVISFFFDGVICVSKAIYNSLPKFVQRKPSTKRIHNAIVIKDYDNNTDRTNIRKELAIEDEIFLIGIIGRLSKEKGCREAIELFHHLQTNNFSYKAIFIGEGPDKNMINSLIERYQLTDRVKIVGFKPYIQPYLAALDLLLVPSFTEGISNVILESLTQKVPIIATKVGGTPEIIANGYNGMLVHPGKPYEWYDTVIKLFSDEGLRRQITFNGFQVISDKFSFYQRMLKVEQLYTQILS